MLIHATRSFVRSFFGSSGRYTIESTCEWVYIAIVGAKTKRESKYLPKRVSPQLQTTFQIISFSLIVRGSPALGLLLPVSWESQFSPCLLGALYIKAKTTQFNQWRSISIRRASTILVGTPDESEKARWLDLRAPTLFVSYHRQHLCDSIVYLKLCQGLWRVITYVSMVQQYKHKVVHPIRPSSADIILQIGVSPEVDLWEWKTHKIIHSFVPSPLCVSALGLYKAES